MESKNTILNEIRDISPVLAELQEVNVFRVPEGYFANLTENIHEAVLTDQIKVQMTSQEATPQVPAGYFDDLSRRIMTRIQDGDEETDDILNAIGKVNVFAVPDGYFEQLPGVLLNKIDTKKSRVVSIFKNKPLVYAAAAAIAVILFVGMIFKPYDSNRDSFAIISGKTVVDKGALRYNSQKAFDKGLASLSDAQIMDYLNSHNTMMVHEQLKDAVNTTDMPEQLDYLSDDGTLDRYINSIVNSESLLLKH